MISGANPSLNTTAKEIIKKTLIGFALFLGSWVIVFTVLNLLSANTSLIGKKGGKWFEFSCDTKSVFQLDSKGDGEGDDGDGGEEPGKVVSKIGFVSEKEEEIQFEDASPELLELFDCMSKKSLDDLPKGARVLSSISDIDDKDYDGDGIKIESFLSRCVSNFSDPPCEHGKNSCHYGGTASCSGKSYAADFGNEQYYSQIEKTAKACNSKAYVLEEGDHIHVSIGNANGCSCN